MAADDGRVVSNFILAALHGNPLHIDGDGSQTRSFCFQSDLIDGFVRLMNAPAEVQGPINIGNPHEITVKELAETILKLTESSSGIRYSETFREDDPMQRKPDIAKAREVLGWEPKVKLEDGLRETIAYFRTLDS